MINIVRRQEQVDLLKNEYKAEHVLNSSSENFCDEFTALSKKLKATLLIECVGGDITGTLLECMPSRSKCIFYGALSEKGPSNIDPLLLIGRNQVLEGWLLNDWINGKGITGLMKTIPKIQGLLKNKDWGSSIHKRFGLNDFQGNV